MTIQVKAIEQYFNVALFIMLYKVVLTLKSVDKTLCASIQMKAIDKYIHVVLLNDYTVQICGVHCTRYTYVALFVSQPFKTELLNPVIVICTKKHSVPVEVLP